MEEVIEYASQYQPSIAMQSRLDEHGMKKGPGLGQAGRQIGRQTGRQIATATQPISYRSVVIPREMRTCPKTISTSWFVQPNEFHIVVHKSISKTSSN